MFFILHYYTVLKNSTPIRFSVNSFYWTSRISSILGCEMLTFITRNNHIELSSQLLQLHSSKQIVEWKSSHWRLWFLSRGHFCFFIDVEIHFCLLKTTRSCNTQTHSNTAHEHGGRKFSSIFKLILVTLNLHLALVVGNMIHTVNVLCVRVVDFEDPTRAYIWSQFAQPSDSLSELWFWF